jgi:GNAT superfamily N-acetyltransferase
MHIRAARATDLERLRDVERAAGRAFRDVGMPEIADDEPPSVATLDAYRRAGRAWVAADGADRAVGYLLADPVDGCRHVEQVSVHPDHAGHGFGRALIAHLADAAKADGVPALTLTTFAEVPWNAPYYARLGFRPLADRDLTPGLRAIRAMEAAHGLDRWPRVAMRRDL